MFSVGQIMFDFYMKMSSGVVWVMKGALQDIDNFFFRW